MEWLDLLAPSAAVLAVLAAIGLVVQSIRHGRAIRRLEDRLAERGEAAAEAPLQRIAELQARAQVTAEGGGVSSGVVRTGLAVLAVVAALVVAAAGVWWFVVRDDGGEGTATVAEQPVETAPATPPQDETLVPADPPVISDKSRYTVTIFNASGVTGAAREQMQPVVEGEGYQVGIVDDAPDGTSDLRQSVVMYAEGRRDVGWNVAKDLGIRRAGPVDGITNEQTGGADAVVLVGRDLAGRP
jgi:hypothetical protein